MEQNFDRASNANVEDLLEMLKELYNLQNKTQLEYQHYKPSFALADLPQKNPFIKLNQPFQIDTQDFPDDVDGRPGFILVERPPQSKAPVVAEQVSCWLKDSKQWFDDTVPNEKLVWMDYRVEISQLPVLGENTLSQEGSLKRSDLQLVKSTLSRLFKALSLPQEKILPLDSSEYDKYDLVALTQLVQDPKNLMRFVVESRPLSYKVESCIAYTSDQALIKAIGGLFPVSVPELEALVKQQHDNVLGYSLCRAYSQVKIKVLAKNDSPELLSLLKNALLLRAEWLEQRSLEKEASKWYMLLEKIYHEIERSNDGLELVASNGIVNFDYTLKVQVASDAAADQDTAASDQDKAASDQDSVANSQVDTAKDAAAKPVQLKRERARRSAKISSSGRVEVTCHPVLIRRLKLIQDIQLPNAPFILYDNADRCELYTAALASFDGNFAKLEEEYNDPELYPLDLDKNRGFLQHLANILSSHCYFSEQKHQSNVIEYYHDDEASEICNYPVIFMRNRQIALPSAIDTMVQQLKKEDDHIWREDEENSIVPVVVRDLISATSNSSFHANAARKSRSSSQRKERNSQYPCIKDFSNVDPSTLNEEEQVQYIAHSLNRLDGINAEILLTKTANDAQLQIAESIEKASAVLVQGPPGTGKTHTIANLLGHFLAQGKTVLVISENSKALRVLKDKVEPELQDLCISILSESNQDTIHALQGIIAKYTQYERSRDKLIMQKDNLAKQRLEISLKLMQLRQRIVEQENFEYAQIFDGQEQISSVKAAQNVAKNEAAFKNLLPAITQPLEDCPLTLQQLQFLAQTNQTLSAKLENELMQVVPDLQKLERPEKFAQLINEFKSLRQQFAQVQQNLVDTQKQSWPSRWHCGFKGHSLQFSCDGRTYDFKPSSVTQQMIQAVNVAWNSTGLSQLRAQPLSAHGLVLGWTLWSERFQGWSNASNAQLPSPITSDRQRFERLKQDLQAYTQNFYSVKEELAGYNFTLKGAFLVAGQGRNVYGALDQSTYQELSDLLVELQDYFPQTHGGKIGLFGKFRHSKDQKRLNELLQVNGRDISTSVECSKALKWLDLEKHKQNLAQQWDLVMQDFAEPRFEQLASSDFEKLQNASLKLELFFKGLSWAQNTFKPFIHLLDQYGLPLKFLYEPVLTADPKQNFERFVWACQKCVPYLLRLCLMHNQLEQKQNGILQYRAMVRHGFEQAIKASSPTQAASVALYPKVVEATLYRALVQAVEQINPRAYQQCWEYIEGLQANRETFKLRRKLLELLARVDPVWAQAIAQRQALYGNSVGSDDILQAWQWRNLDCRLQKALSTSLRDLQDEAALLSEQYRKLTTEYASQCAWLFMFQRMQRQGAALKNLHAVASLLEKIGDGRSKSKRMSDRQRELKSLLSQCTQSVPVWIMPLSKVFENFAVGQRKFDILIVDEASQVKIYGIAALFMAKRCIIVGDDKQVSPSAVGSSIDEEKAIFTRYRKSIRLSSNFEMTNSLYDIAKVNYSSIMLQEHFRCVPEIINFCNTLFYDGKIKVLRDATSTKLQPSILTYQVPGGLNDKRTPSGRLKDNVNYIEAIHTVALLKACFESPAYADKTFGVVVMLGTNQIEVIEDLISRYIEPALQNKHQLRCGNASNFQGDERDVILMGLVASSGTKVILNNVENKTFRQAYNVAVSRARDQLWIVSSLNLEEDLKVDDIRYHLLTYAQDPNAYMRKYNEQAQSIETLSDSVFEVDMAHILAQKGYTFQQQYPVGSYRLDFVVKYKQNQVALECDGDAYHSSPEQVAHDLEREGILKRLGWRFVRVRGTHFYRHKEQAVEEMIAQFEKLGILPEYAQNINQDPKIASSSAEAAGARAAGASIKDGSASAKTADNTLRQTKLVQDIKIRAKQILWNWHDAEYENRLEQKQRQELMQAQKDALTGKFEKQRDVSQQQSQANASINLESSMSAEDEPLQDFPSDQNLAAAQESAGTKAAGTRANTAKSDAEAARVGAKAKARDIPALTMAQNSKADLPQARNAALTAQGETMPVPSAANRGKQALSGPSTAAAQNTFAQARQQLQNLQNQGRPHELTMSHGQNEQTMQPAQQQFGASHAQHTPGLISTTFTSRIVDVQAEDLEDDLVPAQPVVSESESAASEPTAPQSEVFFAIGPVRRKIAAAAATQARAQLAATRSSDLTVPAALPVAQPLQAEQAQVKSHATKAQTKAAVSSAPSAASKTLAPSEATNLPVSSAQQPQDKQAVKFNIELVQSCLEQQIIFGKKPNREEKFQRFESNELRNAGFMTHGVYGRKENVKFDELSQPELKGLNSYKNKLKSCKDNSLLKKLRKFDQIDKKALLSICIPQNKMLNHLHFIEGSGLMFEPNYEKAAPEGYIWFVNQRPRSFAELKSKYDAFKLLKDAQEDASAQDQSEELLEDDDNA